MSALSVSLLSVVIATIVNGSPAPAPTPPAPAQYDTIVVGVGAAGAAAAAALAGAGRRVLALEAQHRLGGRVHTVPFGDSLVELGAEWIHGTENSPTYELAITNNITILEQETGRRVYWSDGSSDREQLVIELAHVGMEAYSHPPEEPLPLGQHISGKIREYINEIHPEMQNDTDLIESLLDFMDQLVDGHEASNSWNDVTTDSNNQLLAGSQAMSWHVHGYSTLFDILLNKYNDGPGYPSLEVKLNTEVTHIQWPQDPLEHVVVTVRDGSTYTARNAIVTVSVGVLKERYSTLFSPALPEEKVNAIKWISFGVCAKMIFRFAEVWWPQNTFGAFLWRAADRARVPPADSWLLRVNCAGPPMANNHSLTLWACGDAAKKVESLPEDVVKTKVMALMRRFMGVGRTVPDPVEILISRWWSSPWSRGAYSFDGVSRSPTPALQHAAARARLAGALRDAAAAPRLLFAGEATDITHFGTVHGAVESGRREANRLLSAGAN